jgi:hypothetical protein
MTEMADLRWATPQDALAAREDFSLRGNVFAEVDDQGLAHRIDPDRVLTEAAPELVPPVLPPFKPDPRAVTDESIRSGVHVVTNEGPEQHDALKRRREAEASLFQYPYAFGGEFGTVGVVFSAGERSREEVDAVVRERMRGGGVITVRKARVGWRVDGRWCPTRKVRDREIRRVRERTGKTSVRTPG